MAGDANRFVRRYEHNYFTGWVVQMRRRGERYVTYFSDRPNGRREALKRARAHRDALLRRLPPPIRVKRVYVRNTTGVIGVTIATDRTRNGRLIERYIATWPTTQGGRGKRSFSVNLHGRTKARQLAIAARRQGLADVGLKP